MGGLAAVVVVVVVVPFLKPSDSLFEQHQVILG